jgi:nucleotide-binding universal stress UspA family protein
VYTLAPTIAEELSDADAYLARAAQDVGGAVPTVHVSTKIGQPGLAIADAAREADADLIAMATHGRGGLARLVLGSVATSTLRHARVPVFFVRPPVETY